MRKANGCFVPSEFLSKDSLPQLVLWLPMDVFSFRDEWLTATCLPGPSIFRVTPLGKKVVSLPVNAHSEEPDWSQVRCHQPTCRARE